MYRVELGVRHRSGLANITTGLNWTPGAHLWWPKGIDGSSVSPVSLAIPDLFKILLPQVPHHLPESAAGGHRPVLRNQEGLPGFVTFSWLRVKQGFILLFPH
jgi:hypothetical protein